VRVSITYQPSSQRLETWKPAWAWMKAPSLFWQPRSLRSARLRVVVGVSVPVRWGQYGLTGAVDHGGITMVVDAKWLQVEVAGCALMGEGLSC
jgi:hypothetical protein